jgi:hypothetical protein
MFNREISQIELSKEKSIKFSLINGQVNSLSVGQSWQERIGWGYECSQLMTTFEIVGFAAPSARGRIDKWDADASIPSVILKNTTTIHDQDEFEVRSAWDCEKGF